MQFVMGAPVPVFLQNMGAAATVLAAVPLALAGYNLLKTTRGQAELAANSPSLRFTVAGILGMLLLALLGCVLAFPESMRFTRFSLAGYGYDMLALYGFFSMCMFGAIYFIVPRVTCREWLSRRLIRTHFWFSVYGIGIYGAFRQGAAQENIDQPWQDVVSTTFPFAVGTTLAWCAVLWANISFFLHLKLMWMRLRPRQQPPLPTHTSNLPETMTLKTFLIGMIASFGIAWMCMIAIPVAKMASPPPVKMSSGEDADYYERKTSGRILNGAEVYAANGCYACHSQLIRPAYLGSQILAKDIAGVNNADGDTRRETHYDDYSGERYALIGLTRMGPDRPPLQPAQRCAQARCRGWRNRHVMVKLPAAAPHV